ncbi:MAG: flagellar basal body-associated FliL family protein [Bdellovibrionota bacterium]
MAEEQDKQAPEGEAQTEEGAKPKKKLPVLLILGVTQTLATLGFGFIVISGLSTMNKSSVSTHELTERAIASVHDETTQIQWVELAPFVTNTASKNSIKTSLNVEVSDSQTAALIKSRMPAIRSRILSLLSQQDTKSLRKVQDKLLLKDALRETISQELAHNGVEPGMIRDVYLIDFMIR